MRFSGGCECWKKWREDPLRPDAKVMARLELYSADCRSTTELLGDTTIITNM